MTKSDRTSALRHNLAVTIDDEILAVATEARVRMEEAQRALNERRSEFEDAVRLLHTAGATLGEVVATLAINGSEASRILGLTPHDVLVCSFCGTSQRDAASMIAGPFVYICDRCVVSAIDKIENRPARDPERTAMVLVPAADIATCGFCGRERHQAAHLVSVSGGARICGDCLDLCTQIIEEERPTAP